jgi:RecA-family ATPase
MKANYAAAGGEIVMRWQAGRFELEGRHIASRFDRIAGEARAEEVFLRLLTAYATEGRDARPAPGPGYAPVAFAKDGRADGIGKRALEGAMNRLFARNAIRVEEHGPPSRRYRRIAMVLPEAAG